VVLNKEADRTFLYSPPQM